MKRFLILLCLVSLPAAIVSAQNEDLIAINIAPYIYLDDQGAVAGNFSKNFVDLARRLGNTATLQVVPFARAAQAQKNSVIVAMARTPERESLFKWGIPVYKDKFVFFAKKGTIPRATSLADLKDRSVAVLRGGAGETLLKSNNFTKIELDPDVGTSARKMGNNRTQLWYTANQSGLYSLKSEGFNPNDFEVVFEGSAFFNWIAFTKDIPDSRVAQWVAAARAMGLEQK